MFNLGVSEDYERERAEEQLAEIKRGRFYRDFRQLPDGEVRELLGAADRERKASEASREK